MKVEKTIFRQNLEKCGKIAKFVNCFKNYLLIATIEENTSKLFFRYITTLNSLCAEDEDTLLVTNYILCIVSSINQINRHFQEVLVCFIKA